MARIEILHLGPLETNCYVIHDDREALVIDPGGEPEKIVALLQGQGLVLRTILNTHFHFDHIQGNAGLQAATGARIFACPRDAFLLETELGGGGMMGFPRTPSFSFEALDEGDEHWLGMSCRVLATPGHSPGSLSFYFESLGAVFCGDVLFYRSVGRTDFPGCSEQDLLRSVRARIFALPGETVVYPGHGPETTVSAEQLNNPFFTEFVR